MSMYKVENSNDIFQYKDHNQTLSNTTTTVPFKLPTYQLADTSPNNRQLTRHASSQGISYFDCIYFVAVTISTVF